ncbi:hypothetical protein AVEN_62714-1 [Araneus ventricosus]|uniref:Uncharacterized protein n=1 Tax=Araneus ventricosus TaxID=182803 RepID=A0A4Y2KYV0_ARAVE|nr:hypothetical protein AVEN_62714-1 [Araneus ventricosus]
MASSANTTSFNFASDKPGNCSQRFQFKEQKAIILSNIPSALRPVLHGPGKPVPSPPDTVANIFYSDTEYECEIDDDFDEVYDSISDETKLFTQSETLVRDLNLPKDSAEVLGFRLKEKYFLAPGTSFSWFRKRTTVHSVFFQAVELVYCTDISALIARFKVHYKPDEWRLFIDSSERSIKAIA